jgi:hypothetical protein
MALINLSLRNGLLGKNLLNVDIILYFVIHHFSHEIGRFFFIFLHYEAINYIKIV